MAILRGMALYYPCDFVYYAILYIGPGSVDKQTPSLPGPRPADDATSEKQILFRQKDAGIEG